MKSTKPSNDGNPATAGRVACARCGAELDCNPAGECWCKAEPVRLPMPSLGSSETCLCPACLRAAARA